MTDPAKNAVKKICQSCKHGPNLNGKLFPHEGQAGCQRMGKIDRMFPTLSPEMQVRAEALSTEIIIHLQKIWRKEPSEGCPGWQT
tara:strand:+ start:476 stop:730 length:255 start_codon:yes stop_codon:yes gene_type:complete